MIKILQLKEKNILPGLTKSNEFIARDERLHTEFGCLLYSMIKYGISEKEVFDKLKSDFVEKKAEIKEMEEGKNICSICGKMF